MAKKDYIHVQINRTANLQRLINRVHNETSPSYEVKMCVRYIHIVIIRQ